MSTSCAEQTSTCPAIRSEKEVKQVCGKISSLLLDKESRNHASRMFKKQRERSENFTTSGFGQKPVDQDSVPNSMNLEKESESTSTSKEDVQNCNSKENNILIKDLGLKSVDEVIHYQQNNKSGHDFVKAKLGKPKFTGRKRDMEDANVQHLLEDTMSSNACRSASLNSEILEHSQDKGSSDGIATSSDVLIAAKPSRLKKCTTKHQPTTRVRYLQNPNQYENFTSDQHQPHDFVKRKRRTRPRERLPWAEPDTFPDDTVSSQTNEDDPLSSSHSFADNESYEETSQGSSQRKGFRRVKPPEPNVLPPRLFDINNLYIGTDEEQNFERLTDEFDVASRVPRKSWSSVKFQPEKKTSQTTETREKTHTLFSPTSNSGDESDRNSPSWFPAVTNHITTPAVKSFQKNSLTPSVALLHKPISPSTKPYYDTTAEDERGSVELELTANNKLKKDSVRYSVRGDLSPRNTSPQPLVPTGKQKLLPLQNVHFPVTQSRNQGNNLNLTHQKQPSDPSQASVSLPNKDEDLKSSSVAACMKILDPNKGRYQPKMALVYKPTPSIGAKFDEDDDERPSSRHSYSERTQFNKPVKVSADLSQVSYIGNFQTASNKMESLKPAKKELKGKGAEIFEKQQRRMEIYTKETHADLQNDFRSNPNDDSSRYSCATTAVKDRNHHQFQNINASRRPPSAADFVCVDTSSNFTSDSIYSSPSSMTSYDLASCTSSAKQEDKRSNDPAKSKIPPTLAPKPKFKRVISPDLTTATTPSDDTVV